MLLISLSFALLQVLMMVSASFEQCGNVNEEQFLNGELVLGNEEYPWMGIVREDDISKILCISMLITRRHVILPAHCVTDKIDSIVFKNPLQKRGGSNEVSYQLEEVAIHPDYALFQDSDLAVGTLNKDVVDIQPICMPPKDKRQYFGQRLEMIGSTFEQPNIRIKGKAQIATSDYCLKLIDTIFNPSNNYCGYITRNFLSGSAIMDIHVVEGKPLAMKFYVVGVVLYRSKKIGRSQMSYVFLNINHFRDWITQNTIE